MKKLEPEAFRPYESKWVAIDETGDEERIVGSGEDAVEAKRDAAEKGHTDVVLFWVRPFNASFIGGAF